MRQLELDRYLFGEVSLGRDGRFGRASADGEVVAGDDNWTAVDLGNAGDEIRGCEPDEFAVIVVFPDTGSGSM